VHQPLPCDLPVRPAGWCSFYLCSESFVSLMRRNTTSFASLSLAPIRLPSVSLRSYGLERRDRVDELRRLKMHTLNPMTVASSEMAGVKN
jgi:hypothetical protein